MRAIALCLALSVLMAIWPRLTTQAQATPEMASVQIVNATSVPVLALKVNDTLAYDTFPQGKRSGDAPVPLLEAVYEAEDKRSGLRAKSDKITYECGTHQRLSFWAISPPARQQGSSGSRTVRSRARMANTRQTCSSKYILICPRKRL